MIEIILGILVIILFTHLFCLKRDLKKLNKDLTHYKKIDTNNLLHTSSMDKDLKQMICQINDELQKIKTKEILIKQQSWRLKKMMTNISHDLKTPLTSAIGYIEMIQSSTIDHEKKQKYISIIEERLHKLSSLIQSFFEFSSILSKDETPVIENQEIIPILEQCIISYYEDFDQEKRKIILKDHLQNKKIQTNKMMLIRIFDNIIGNSLKHGINDLIITLTEDDQTLSIAFQNEMTDTLLDVNQIFDEFYTTDISRTSGNTGLGLAIVKEFVTLLGGTVDAKIQKETLIITLHFPKNRRS